MTTEILLVGAFIVLLVLYLGRRRSRMRKED